MLRRIGDIEIAPTVNADAGWAGQGFDGERQSAVCRCALDRGQDQCTVVAPDHPVQRKAGPGILHVEV